MLFSALVDAEAWIETPPCQRRTGRETVASLAEAWIETIVQITSALASERSPPSRRRG